MAGLTVDAAEVQRLAAELERNALALVAGARVVTVAAATKMRDTARELAKSRSMPGLSKSIGILPRNTLSGVSVTVAARSPFGYIREFGAGRSGPHPFMLPALQQHQPKWEQDIAQLLARVL